MAVFEVYVDGAAQGQGVDGAVRGAGACAVAIYKNGKLHSQFARGLGARTNNECEYEAVIHAILLCWGMDLGDPVIYSDSQLVVKQVNGEWRNNTVELAPLLATVSDLREVYRFRVVQVPRAACWHPDALCRLFLEKLTADGQKI